MRAKPKKSGSGERGQIALLRQLFGREYVNGLSTLEKALSAIAREGSFRMRSESTGWRVSKLITHTHFGVISKASLMITGAQRLQSAAFTFEPLGAGFLWGAGYRTRRERAWGPRPPA